VLIIVIMLLQLLSVTITRLTADAHIRSSSFWSVSSTSVHSPRTTYCRQQRGGSGPWIGSSQRYAVLLLGCYWTLLSNLPCWSYCFKLHVMEVPFSIGH